MSTAPAIAATDDLFDLLFGGAAEVHPFTASGMGEAPFVFAGTEEVSAPTTCDHCGTGIRNVFLVRSACGRVGKVGCDCIRKTEDAALVDAAEAAEKILRARKAAAKKAQKADDARTAADAILADAGRLEAFPHPYDFDGLTLADYVRHTLRSPTARNVAKAARAIREAAE